MYNTIKHQYLAIIWSIIVLILCNMPMETGSLPLFSGFDKIVHLGFFFILTIFLFYGKIRQQLTYTYRIETIVKILVVTTILGGGIELLQWKIFTYRSAEWNDFLANMTGVGMGIFSYIFLHRARFNENTADRISKQK